MQHVSSLQIFPKRSCDTKESIIKFGFLLKEFFRYSNLTFLDLRIVTPITQDAAAIPINPSKIK
jgi:hypothetical protein